MKNQIRRRNLNRSRNRKAIPQSLVILIRTIMIRMRNHTKLTCHPKKLRYEFTSTYYTCIHIRKHIRKYIWKYIRKCIRKNKRKMAKWPKFDFSQNSIQGFKSISVFTIFRLGLVEQFTNPRTPPTAIFWLPIRFEALL